MTLRETLTRLEWSCAEHGNFLVKKTVRSHRRRQTKEEKPVEDVPAAPDATTGDTLSDPLLHIPLN